MKRRKLIVLLLVLLVFLVCMVVSFIFVASIVLRTSPSDLLQNFVAVGFILKEEFSQPRMLPPSEIFRQYVMDPMPESVTNIKADQPKRTFGYRYILRFDINRVDLNLLINSRPFQRVWNVKYVNGSLYWDWDRPGPLGISEFGSSTIVYHPQGPRKSGWFRPNLGNNPEVYVFQKVGDRVNTQIFGYEPKVYDRHDTQVLLYNEKEGEAYFIVSRLK